MHFEIIGKIESIETIAVQSSIRELDRLRKQYGYGRWRKMKGAATVRLDGGRICKVELHWYQAHGIGKRKMAHPGNEYLLLAGSYTICSITVFYAPGSALFQLFVFLFLSDQHVERGAKSRPQRSAREQAEGESLLCPQRNIFLSQPEKKRRIAVKAAFHRKVRVSRMNQKDENKTLFRLSLQKMENQEKIKFGVCITDAEPDLEPKKIYRILPDETAAKDSYFRVIDESGEDYLYPARYFVLVDAAHTPDRERLLVI